MTPHARPGWELARQTRRREQLRLVGWTLVVIVGALIGGLTAPFGIFPK